MRRRVIMQIAKHDGVRCAGRSHGKDDAWKQHAALKCLSKSARSTSMSLDMLEMRDNDAVLPTK